MATERKRSPKKRVAPGIDRRDGRYLVTVYEATSGRPRQTTLPAGTTLREAKAWKAEQEALKDRGRAGSLETVREFAARWGEAFPHRKASTIKHNRERVTAFVKDFADRPLSDVSPVEARLWALGGTAPDNLKATVELWHGATRDNDIVTVPAHRSNVPAVRALFGDAVRSGIITANPFVNLRVEKGKGRQHITVLTEQEVDRLAQVARDTLGDYGEHFADLILTAAWTGLRPGELFALIPERVDLEQRVVHVVESADNKTGRLGGTKTGNERVVPLLPKAEAALRNSLQYRDHGEFVFQPPRTRDRLYVDGVASMKGMGAGYWFRRVRDVFTDRLPDSHWLKRETKAGRPLHLYALRHAAGTRLAERGVPPYDIAQFLGHTDGGALAMTVYLHVDPDTSHERLRRLFNEEAA